MTHMMIKKRPPADPLLRRSNRAELRRPLSTLGRFYKVFACCVFYFFRIHGLFLRVEVLGGGLCALYICVFSQMNRP